MRIELFASGDVGRAALGVMLERGVPPEAIVADSAELDALLKHAGGAAADAVTAQELASPAGIDRLRALELDLGILAWWPHLLRKPLLDVPRLGYLNFHPSYLPYNRGKHYNFWTLVEETPFGVTIHWVAEGIDDGDIAFQRRIEKTWEDTGMSLYQRAGTELISLFRDNIERIALGRIPREAQPDGIGSFHRTDELAEASRIDLDGTYNGRTLLNLLRARTFPPHPAAWFEDNGHRYEAEIRIKRTR